MKLLFDQNLSFRMVLIVSDLYPDSQHVREVGLHEATDEEIWRYAAANGFTIVSKDTDFHLMSVMYGHPPKVIWLRIGNASTRAASDLLYRRHSTIREFHTDSEVSFLALG